MFLRSLMKQEVINYIALNFCFIIGPWDSVYYKLMGHVVLFGDQILLPCFGRRTLHCIVYDFKKVDLINDNI